MLSVNLPRLRSRDREVDLTRVPSSVVVSVFSSRGSAVFAVLEADFHFEFPAIDQAENRPPVPNSFHSEMLMLGRDNLYALLNAMGLTGVAVEIGVYKGDFALRMLRNWSGSRLGRLTIYNELFGDVQGQCLMVFQIRNGGSLAPLAR